MTRLNDEHMAAWIFDRGGPEPEKYPVNPYESRDVMRCGCGAEFDVFSFARWANHECEFRREEPGDA